MKTRILTLLICSLTLFNAGAVTITAVPNEEKKDVELQGTTEDDNPKSLLLPFEAYQAGNESLCVTSLHDFASATISILDAYGRTLDEQTSSLMFLQSITFDISGYAPGTYTLVISTPQGTYLSGMFAIE